MATRRALLGIGGAVALGWFVWARFHLGAARTCYAGDYVLFADGPRRAGIGVGEWIACDLTLRKRGLFAAPGEIQTTGGGLCERSCGDLVSADGAQVLVGGMWYSADRGHSFRLARELIPPGAFAGDACISFDLPSGALRGRAWMTCSDDAKEPSRSILSRDGGRSWEAE